MPQTKTRYFEYRDAKSQKFWEMSWSGASYSVRYGKIGTRGKTTTKSFASTEEAKAAANALMLAKHNKCYVYLPDQDAPSDRGAATPFTAADYFQPRPLTSDEIAKLRAIPRGKHTPKLVNRVIEEVGKWFTDAYYHEGDLALDGDFYSGESKVALLVVDGDLSVSGNYQDSDDPESVVIVTGSLEARSVITAGWLEVHGDVKVESAFLGDYNDCSAEIFGDLRAELVYPEEHYIKVHGKASARHFVGISARLDASNSVEFVRDTDDEIVDILDNDLLEIERDEEEICDVWLERYGELKQRVREGKSIYKR